MTKPYHEIITGEARSTITIIVILKLGEVGVPFGRYPGFNICFGLDYLHYCD